MLQRPPTVRTGGCRSGEAPLKGRLFLPPAVPFLLPSLLFWATESWGMLPVIPSPTVTGRWPEECVGAAWPQGWVQARWIQVQERPSHRTEMRGPRKKGMEPQGGARGSHPAPHSRSEVKCLQKIPQDSELLKGHNRKPVRRLSRQLSEHL